MIWEIKEAITCAIKTLYGDIAIPDFAIETPDIAAHGDYASNTAMVLAKTLKKNPMEIARVLAEEIEKNATDIIERIEVAVPGFLNITIKHDAIVAMAKDILARPGAWGRGQEGKGKTVIVEYFQLNIAKEPHVGHLRSAVIGDALKRVLHARGYHIIADSHVGDWGTQFGILLWAYKKAVEGDDDVKKKIQENPFAALQELYLSINAEEDAHEKGKIEFAKLEQGDKENRAIWEWMVEISMKKLEYSALRLKLLAFEEHKGESAYENDMSQIVALALRKGVAKKTDDGAVIVDLTHEKLDEAVLVKSDGATTYLLRDLATIQYRKEKYNFWKNLYIVDNRQSHHFRQVFRVAELLGFEGIGDSVHIEFGFMKLSEGAMSTRKGNVILLDEVIDEAERRAVAIMKEKNPDLKDLDLAAKRVGLGAIKYFDLSHHRVSDIVFRWEDVLSFEGNTGPYIQYTHARLKSILRKAGDITHEFPANILSDAEEKKLLLACVQLPEAEDRVLTTWSPHLLAAYLFMLAQKANEFYHSHPVLAEKDPAKKQFLLAIVEATAITLAVGLSLLGIDAPEEM